MEVTRLGVVIPPPADVLIRLTYREAQYLRGILNFFDRMAAMGNFRGTFDTFIAVHKFVMDLDRSLRRLGINHYNSNPTDPIIDA
jgi:hypothetical protein